MAGSGSDCFVIESLSTVIKPSFPIQDFGRDQIP